MGDQLQDRSSRVGAHDALQTLLEAGGAVMFAIVDTETGRTCGKLYRQRRKAREQARRMNTSAGRLWRFTVVEAVQ
jgi:hypothetical protein